MLGLRARRRAEDAMLLFPDLLPRRERFELIDAYVDDTTADPDAIGRAVGESIEEEYSEGERARIWKGAVREVRPTKGAAADGRDISSYPRGQ